jgi:ferritin
MDRPMQLRRLEEAEQHVVRGERLISEQKVRIANLERDGHDSTTARELLETYRALQVEHIKNRDRIIKELEE